MLPPDLLPGCTGVCLGSFVAVTRGQVLWLLDVKRSGMLFISYTAQDIPAKLIDM